MIHTVLSNFKVKIKNHSVLMCKSNNDDYIQNIINWNQVFTEFIREHQRPRAFSELWKIDIIFTSPSIYREKLSFDRRKEFEEIDKKKLIKLSNVAQKQKKYFLETSPGLLFDIDEKNADLSKEMKIITSFRRKEAELYTHFMSIILASKLCPVFRIQPEIDTGIQKEINNFISSLDKEKNNKCYNDFLNSISRIIPNGYIKQIPINKVCKIKIYSDGPIEFLRTNTNSNLPLFLEHSVCKIPMIPGNVFINNLINDQLLEISYEEICNITIIRSFRDADPIKYSLENACHLFFDSLQDSNSNSDHDFMKRVDYQIIDVQSISELIEALNSIHSKIVIFDCHGSDNSYKEENGWLHIGSEKFNVFEYKYKVRIPKIVILSACETHPMKANYLSVANGFLLAGAITVLATNSPIKSNIASEYIARILFRINDYFPAVYKYRKDFPTVTWLEFISGMQKMLYVTEILRHFLINKVINQKSYFKLHIFGNTVINSNQPNWYNKFINEISACIKIDKDKILTIIDEELGFCDSMKYILLGNADNIFINNDGSI